MNTLKRLTCFSAALATWGLVQSAALALPGVSLQETRASIRRSELFSGMELVQDAWGYTVSIGTENNKGVVLYVGESGGMVTAEMLQVRYPELSMAFERDNEIGLSLIASTWNDSVVTDFVNSRYTVAIEGSLTGPPDRYYLGDRYGYIVSFNPHHNGNSGIHSLRVVTHSDWEAAQHTARFCLNNPNHENCSGI